MGSYTPNFKLYKPDPEEVVDLERDLNTNWNILDIQLKRLMEYRYTDTVSVNTEFPDKLPMHKFYKTWSNSIIFEDFDSTLEQDEKAKVYGWTSARSLMGADWSNKHDNGVYYRRIYRPDVGVDRVEWTGAMVYKSGALIPPYTEFADILNLPSEITPKMSRYFHRTAGNCDAGYSVARLIFSRFGKVSVVRYGNDPSNSGHNKIDLSTIRYDLNLEGS